MSKNLNKLTKYFSKHNDPCVFTRGHVPFNKTLHPPHYFCSVFVPQGWATLLVSSILNECFPVCLEFQDDILTVIRRVDENWAEGMLGDKIGIFPISYVEVRRLTGLYSVTNRSRSRCLTKISSFEHLPYISHKICMILRILFEMLMFHWTIKNVFEDLDSRGLTDSLV